MHTKYCASHCTFIIWLCVSGESHCSEWWALCGVPRWCQIWQWTSWVQVNRKFAVFLIFSLYTSHQLTATFWEPSSLPHEVPKTAAADQMASIYPERWDLCDSHPTLRPSAVIIMPSSAKCPGCQTLRLTRHSSWLNCQVSLSLGQPPSSHWHCHPGHPS